MPVRTCPHCGKRNLLDGPRCSYCQKPLPAGIGASAPPAGAPPRPSPPPSPRSPSAAPTWGTPAPPPPSPFPPAAGAAPAPPPSPPLPTPAAPAPPAPLPAPFPVPAPAPIPTLGWPAAAPAPLPPKLAHRGTPHLQGEVVDMSEVPNLVLDGCLVGTLRAFAGGGRAVREHQTVYLVRVRRPDGGEEQARIEKDVIAAMPRLGDAVSLWGRRRYGVLVIRNGYNHSVSAEIRVR